MQCQWGKKHPPSIIALLQSLGLVVSTSRSYPSAPDPDGSYPPSSTLGRDSRQWNCLQEERTQHPQQNPSTKWGSLVNLQFSTTAVQNLSSSSATIPEEGKDWVSSLIEPLHKLKWSEHWEVVHTKSQSSYLTERLLGTSCFISKKVKVQFSTWTLYCSSKALL